MTDALIDGAPPTEPPTSWPWDFLHTRRVLSRHLVGDGIDIGPGPHPFPIVNPGVRVRYVDRHVPDENAGLFPELEGGGFQPPDIISDLDVDGLAAVDDQSVDFAVASHVLEHLANPLRLVDDAHRALRDGGLLVILLPEPSRTFDRHRPITRLDEVVAEYERGTESVPDARIVAFLEETGNELPQDLDERRRLIELHRRRSVHVYVWTPDAFFEVLLYGVRALGHRWELVDAVLAQEEGPEGFDFGWVLRRTARDDPPEVLAAQLAGQWQLWRARTEAMCRTFDELTSGLSERSASAAELADEAARLAAERDASRAELDALLQTRTLRLLGPARRGYGWARAVLRRR